jgi:Zinc carboxypeptidase
MRHAVLLIAPILLLAGCATHGTTHAAPAVTPSGNSALATPAEQSSYTKTTPYDAVVAYLHLLVQRATADSIAGRRPHAMLVESTSGTTTEGRPLPYVVLARPMVHSAREAHDSGRPIVYVEANIHAGEVEGKEAMLALLRDLGVLASPNAPSVLDSIVLVVEPIYNADGNDHFAPQSVNRTEQNGPEIVGERTNGQHLDLNRDFIKAEAPETRMTLGMFRDWDPDVFVDLHTTDGSFHGYALTYAPPLDPAALFTGPYTRDSLLPVLRQRMHDRHRIEVFDYGNFEPERTPGADTGHSVWRTYDSRPRFGTNYAGLRNRIAILSEAYSHDPFAQRVATTYAFVREILSLVAERRAQILTLTASADSAVVHLATHLGQGEDIPLRSAFAPARGVEPVIVEDLDRVPGPGGDTTLTQPGVPRGLRRTGRVHPVPMPVVDRFIPTLAERLPLAYIIPSTDTAVIRLLRLHGIRMEQQSAPIEFESAEQFHIDSVTIAPAAFQGHHEATVAGRWMPSASAGAVPAGAWMVPSAQPLGILATYLLDPRSADGVVTWNLLNADLRPGGVLSIVRLAIHP